MFQEAFASEQADKKPGIKKTSRATLKIVDPAYLDHIIYPSIPANNKLLTGKTLIRSCQQQCQYCRDNSRKYRAPSDHYLASQKRRQYQHQRKHEDRFNECQNIGQFRFFRCIKSGCGDSCDRNKRDRNQKIGMILVTSVFTASEEPNSIPIYPLPRYMMAHPARTSITANVYAIGKHLSVCP